jgi:hypothetical protein
MGRIKNKFEKKRSLLGFYQVTRVPGWADGWPIYSRPIEWEVY